MIVWSLRSLVAFGANSRDHWEMAAVGKLRMVESVAPVGI
jgi:hypothetical protein